MNPYEEKSKLNQLSEATEDIINTPPMEAPKSDQPALPTETPKTGEAESAKESKQEATVPSDFPLISTGEWNETANTKKFYQPVIENPKSSDLYELFAVVVHSGGAYGGHYHVLIRDLEKRDKDFKLCTPEDRLDHLLKDVNTDSGQWYDFNDSSVKPISVKQLVNQYGGGSECAYMLYYRKISLPVPPIQDIPPYLNELISKENQQLTKERDEYTKALNSVRITVTLPRYYVYEKDFLTYKFTQEGKGKKGNEAEEQENSQQPAADKEENSTTDQESDNQEKVEAIPNITKQLKKERKEVSKLSANDELMFATVKASETVLSEQEQQKRGIYKLVVDQREAFSKFLDQVSSLIQMEELCLSEVAYKARKLHVLKDFRHIDPQMSLKDLGIKHGCELLAWNGVDINGNPWDGEGPSITPSIKVFKKRKDLEMIIPTEVKFTLKENTTMAEFRRRLEKETGILVEHQYLCKLAYHQLSIIRSAVDNKTLFELQIDDFSRFTLEEQADPDNFKSIAEKHMAKLEGQYDIYVDDHVTSLGTLCIESDKNTTLREFKQRILSMIIVSTSDQIDHRKVRLSRYQSKDSNTLVTFTDERSTLHQAGIRDNSRLVLEEGEPPTQLYHIYFRVSQNGKITTSSPLELTVHKRSTVLDCKTEMAALIMKTADRFQIRKTTEGKPTEIISDEDLTLMDAGIDDEDLLWLEDGIEVLQGHVRGHFRMYTTFELAQPYGYSLGSPSVHLNSMYERTEQDNFALSELFSIDVSNLWTLDELKTHLLKQSQLEHLKEKPALLRIWGEDHLLTKGTATLKKLGVKGDFYSFTLQVMDDEKQNINDDSTLLLYQQLRVVEHQSFGPPHPLLFSGNTIEEFFEFLQKQNPTIPFETMEIHKYNKFSGQWINLKQTQIDQAKLKEKEENEKLEREKAKKGKGPQKSETQGNETGTNIENENEISNKNQMKEKENDQMNENNEKEKGKDQMNEKENDQMNEKENDQMNEKENDQMNEKEKEKENETNSKDKTDTNKKPEDLFNEQSLPCPICEQNVFIGSGNPDDIMERHITSGCEDVNKAAFLHMQESKNRPSSNNNNNNHSSKPPKEQKKKQPKAASFTNKIRNKPYAFAHGDLVVIKDTTQDPENRLDDWVRQWSRQRKQHARDESSLAKRASQERSGAPTANSSHSSERDVGVPKIILDFG